MLALSVGNGCGLDLVRRTVAPTLPNIEERMNPLTYRIRLSRPVGVMLILAAGASLAGCGVVAAPVRATSAVVSVVPIAGPIAAAPLDVTANTID
jgi:hypothetical protein